MNGLTETEADTLAARLFLADQGQPYAGPWASLPADVQEPYRAQAQAAQDYFTARAVEAAEHDEKVNDRYHESVTTPECSETCAPHLHLHCSIDCERACSTCAERVTDHFVTITRGHLDWLREKAGLASAPQTPAGGHAPDALAMVGSEREAGTAPPAGPATPEPDPLAMDDHGVYLDPVRAAAERKRVAEVVAASEARAQVDETWRFPDPQRARLGTEDERLADQVRAECDAVGVAHDLTLLIRHHRADAARAAARRLGS